MADCHHISYGGWLYDKLYDDVIMTNCSNKFLTIGVCFDFLKYDRYTSHLKSEDDIWIAASSMSKAARMR